MEQDFKQVSRSFQNKNMRHQASFEEPIIPFIKHNQTQHAQWKQVCLQRGKQNNSRTTQKLIKQTWKKTGRNKTFPGLLQRRESQQKGSMQV